MRKNTEDELLSADQVAEVLHNRRTGKDKLYKRENGRLVVDHVRTANAMAMFIVNIPMDRIFKKVLLMRLGSPLIHKKTMTHMAIALSLGMGEPEVREIEKVALGICNEFMQKSTGNMFSGINNKSLITDTMNDVSKINPNVGSGIKNGEDPQ